jgi:hypothetical protein
VPASPRPADQYRVRRAARDEERARLSEADRRFSTIRLAVFALGVLVAVLAWRGFTTAWLIPAPVVVFLIVVARHERVIQAREAAARGSAFYERGLARIEDRWHGAGDPGDRFRSERHPYADDVDLFGHGSLFQLLSLARTRAGEAVLAGWLTVPAPPSEIAARQEAVTELTPALDLREALSLAGAAVQAGVHGDELVAWAEAPRQLSPAWVRWVAAAMTVLVVSAGTLWLATGYEWPLLVSLGAQVGFAWPWQRRVERALHQAAAAARDLDILGHLLERLERETFSSARLRAIRAAIGARNGRASAAIHALHRLVALHDWQHNLLFLLVSIVFLWGTHVAWAIEAWRSRNGRDVRRWLAAVAEIEALASLSAYRFEHPGDPFPQLVGAEPSGRPALFDGVALGHPLLPAARCVRNDVRLDGNTQLFVVSGSNMSGKSTLLRTVGINAVLALAGAPVRAASLRLSPLSLGATLRIQDSLQEGRSRFYAEITRIRELADLARGPAPLLFLLDELFHGTNSHDRLVGASGVLKGLLAHGAIGLVTTHDLALTEVAGTLAPHAVNVHFEDWFEGDEIRFDYRIKQGPVTRSNAIALMRAVGLDVPREG